MGMTKAQKSRYLKRIVSTCITSFIIFAIASHVSAWFGVDTVPVLAIVAAVLGGELMMTAIIKLLEKDKAGQDRTEQDKTGQEEGAG